MSEIRVTTVSDTAGTGPVTLTKQSAAKVWTSDETLQASNSTYTGSSFNVSSITDSATGQCLVNFTNSFANNGFASQGTQNGYSVNDIVSTKEDNITVARDDVYIYDGAYKDAPFSYVAHGDLA